MDEWIVAFTVVAVAAVLLLLWVWRLQDKLDALKDDLSVAQMERDRERQDNADLRKGREHWPL
jgi:hypothetical protein